MMKNVKFFISMVAGNRSEPDNLVVAALKNQSSKSDGKSSSNVSFFESLLSISVSCFKSTRSAATLELFW